MRLAHLHARLGCTYTLLLAWALLACEPHPAPVLRIGINPWPGYELLFLAQEKGYYREAGLEVRLVEFSSLADARRAFERNQLDFLASSSIEVLQAREQSARSPQIIQVVDYSEGADIIVARAGIASMPALRGKRVAVELASLGIYVLARALEMNGLSLKDVQMVSLDPASMETALRGGDVDAAVTYPPTSIRLLREPGVGVLFSTAQIPGDVTDVISADESVIRERPGDVRKLIAAYHRAYTWMEQNPKQAYAIMAAHEHITPEEFADAMTNGMRVVGPAAQASYLAPKGRIAGMLRSYDRILRDVHQLKGSTRLETAFTPLFLQPDSAP